MTSAFDPEAIPHELRDRAAIVWGQTQMMRRFVQQQLSDDGITEPLNRDLDRLEDAIRAVVVTIERIGSDLAPEDGSDAGDPGNEERRPRGGPPP